MRAVTRVNVPNEFFAGVPLTVRGDFPVQMQDVEDGPDGQTGVLIFVPGVSARAVTVVRRGTSDARLSD